MDETEAVAGDKAYKRPTIQELVDFVMADPPAVDNLAELLDLAAVGIVKHAWRNSPLEVREFLRDFFREIFDLDVPPAKMAETRRPSPE
ncbi:hypothetical protein AB0F52_45915 [Amycolatopsis sp. NPDC024027]|uniref:hypothetical protein n=1 Tax=Amycolatopsis sp. NPDC024027 TaxID=3154327 RepID=UPI0034027BED